MLYLLYARTCMCVSVSVSVCVCVRCCYRESRFRASLLQFGLVMCVILVYFRIFKSSRILHVFLCKFLTHICVLFPLV